MINLNDKPALAAYIDTQTTDMDTYITNMLMDPDFKQGYTAVYNKLASAAALVDAREAAGLTQIELAKKAKIPQATIARIERGHNTSIETLTKLALALNKKFSVSFQ